MGNGPLITRTMRRPRPAVVIGGTETHLVINVLKRDKFAAERKTEVVGRVVLLRRAVGLLFHQTCYSTASAGG